MIDMELNSQSSIKEHIEKYGYILYPITGRSMEPMLIEGRDCVYVKKIDRPLKKYDVPLYFRKEGRYVLHRIIKIHNNKYIIRGDNLFFKETDITDDNIVGVLIGFYRKGRYIDCNNLWYKIYYHTWKYTYFPRKFISNIKSFIKQRWNDGC